MFDCSTISSSERPRPSSNPDAAVAALRARAGGDEVAEPGEARERHRLAAQRDAEAGELGEPTGDQRGLRVVAVAETGRGTRRDRDHVLHRAGDLAPDDVGVRVHAEAPGHAELLQLRARCPRRGTRSPTPPAGPSATSRARFGPGEHRDPIRVVAAAARRGSPRSCAAACRARCPSTGSPPGRRSPMQRRRLRQHRAVAVRRHGHHHDVGVGARRREVGRWPRSDVGQRDAGEVARSSRAAARDRVDQRRVRGPRAWSARARSRSRRRWCPTTRRRSTATDAADSTVGSIRAAMFPDAVPHGTHASGVGRSRSARSRSARRASPSTLDPATRARAGRAAGPSRSWPRPRRLPDRRRVLRRRRARRGRDAPRARRCIDDPGTLDAAAAAGRDTSAPRGLHPGRDRARRPPVRPRPAPLARDGAAAGRRARAVPPRRRHAGAVGAHRRSSSASPTGPARSAATPPRRAGSASALRVRARPRPRVRRRRPRRSRRRSPPTSRPRPRRDRAELARPRGCSRSARIPTTSSSGAVRRSPPGRAPARTCELLVLTDGSKGTWDPACRHRGAGRHPAARAAGGGRDARCRATSTSSAPSTASWRPTRARAERVCATGPRRPTRRRARSRPVEAVPPASRSPARRASCVIDGIVAARDPHFFPDAGTPHRPSRPPAVRGAGRRPRRAGRRRRGRRQGRRAPVPPEPVALDHGHRRRTDPTTDGASAPRSSIAIRDRDRRRAGGERVQAHRPTSDRRDRCRTRRGAPEGPFDSMMVAELAALRRRGASPVRAWSPSWRSRRFAVTPAGLLGRAGASPASRGRLLRRGLLRGPTLRGPSCGRPLRGRLLRGPLARRLLGRRRFAAAFFARRLRVVRFAADARRAFFAAVRASPVAVVFFAAAFLAVRRLAGFRAVVFRSSSSQRDAWPAYGPSSSSPLSSVLCVSLREARSPPFARDCSGCRYGGCPDLLVHGGLEGGSCRELHAL